MQNHLKKTLQNSPNSRAVPSLPAQSPPLSSCLLTCWSTLCSRNHIYEGWQKMPFIPWLLPSFLSPTNGTLIHSQDYCQLQILNYPLLLRLGKVEMGRLSVSPSLYCIMLCPNSWSSSVPSLVLTSSTQWKLSSWFQLNRFCRHSWLKSFCAVCLPSLVTLRGHWEETGLCCGSS